MSVTLSQIAKKARLSTAAVSKALNDRPDIAPKTRARVRKIAAAMGYTRNVAAHQLVTKKTMSIGVVTEFPFIPTVIERIRGIGEVAREHDYLTFTCFHDGCLEEELRQLEVACGRIDGVIITPSNHHPRLAESLRAMNMPSVLMSEGLTGFESDFVSDDDHAGGVMVAEHLLAAGHRRIAYLGVSADNLSDRAMLHGLRQGLSEQAISLPPELVRWGNTHLARTASNVDALLATDDARLAIFCHSDTAAMWAMRHLCEKGVRIPEDVALVGYDDIEFSAMAHVPLSTVAQPNLEIGRTAARVLVERIQAEGPPAAFRRILFPPELVVRASSRLPTS